MTTQLRPRVVGREHPGDRLHGLLVEGETRGLVGARGTMLPSLREQSGLHVSYRVPFRAQFRGQTRRELGRGEVHRGAHRGGPRVPERGEVRARPPVRCDVVRRGHRVVCRCCWVWATADRNVPEIQVNIMEIVVGRMRILVPRRPCRVPVVRSASRSARVLVLVLVPVMVPTIGPRIHSARRVGAVWIPARTTSFILGRGCASILVHCLG